MHHSTLIVLLLITFGQMLILAIGGFVLWLSGEFSEERRTRHDPHATNKAAEGQAAATPEAARQSSENGDPLITLTQDHSIQPHVGEHPLTQAEQEPEPSRERKSRPRKIASS
jgi:hypothetical protein